MEINYEITNTFIEKFNNSLFIKNNYNDCINIFHDFLRKLVNIKNLKLCDIKYHNIGKKVKNFKIDLFFDGNKYRGDCIEAFKNSKTFEDCFNNYHHVYKKYIKLKPHKNKNWFKKYYELYYDILNNGYNNDLGNAITVVQIYSKYIRLDGTHRASCLFDITKNKYIDYSINLIDFFDIINNNKFLIIKKKYEHFLNKTIFSCNNYQKINNTLINSYIHERYYYLTKRLSKYIDNNIVLDIGSNNGYNTLMLQKECNPKEIFGIEHRKKNSDISCFFKYYWNLNVKKNDNLSFVYGAAEKQKELLNKCNVIIFLRSIYHCGNSIINILNNLSANTIIIVECNKNHAYKLDNPEKIIPEPGKRLTLAHNVKRFFDNRGYKFLEEFTNNDDVIIYKT